MKRTQEEIRAWDARTVELRKMREARKMKKYLQFTVTVRAELPSDAVDFTADEIREMKKDLADEIGKAIGATDTDTVIVNTLNVKVGN